MIAKVYKKYKKLSITMGALLLLIVVLILGVRIFMTRDVIVSWITPPLEYYTHRKVTLSDARVGLRGFHVEGIEFSKQGATAPLLRSEKLELRWSFMALLLGKIRIHTLAFTGPEITLVRHEDGSFNIADLLPQKPTSEQGASPGKIARSEPTGISLLLELLSTEDGRLTLVDRSRQPQSTLQATNIRTRITDFSTSAPVPFQAEGQFEGEGQGSITLDATYDLPSNTFEGNVNLQSIDLARLVPFISQYNPVVIQQGRLTMAAFVSSEKLDHFKGKGSLSLSNLQIKQDDKLSRVLELQAGFQLDVVHSQQTLSIDALDLDLNGQKANIQGLLTQWQQRPQLNFKLSSPQMRLHELLALLPKSPPPSATTETLPDQPPEQEEPSVEKATVASPSISSSAEVVKQSSETGGVPQATSDSATTTVQPAETEGEQVAKTTEPASTPSEQKPKYLQLDAQGEIHLDWFFYNKLVASNVNCHLSLQEGKLQVEPLSASLYGGTLGGSVKTDLQVSGPPLQYRIYTENVLLDEIIAAFWSATSGSWSGNVDQFSKANGIGTDLSALQSRTELNINAAEFSGHPITQKLAELFQAEDLQELRFSQVSARILTSQGSANIERLHLIGPIVQAEGHGTAGLLDKKLDLHLRLQIRAQYVGKLAQLRDIVPKISDKYGFVELPLNVGGTFDNPEYSLDERWLAKMSKKAAKKPQKKVKKKPPAKSTPSEADKGKLKEDLQKLVQ